MTRQEIVQLLAFIAAYDQRTNGEADVHAWGAVAVHARWGSLAWAKRAVVEHFAAETDRIMPAHITRTLHERRIHFQSTYLHKPTPRDIQGEQAETEWERQQVAQHITTCMDRWAAGERIAA